jgi:Ca2+-binding EF-hand superfamily protein
LVRNSLDEYFDRNEDGYIDDIEVHIAQEILWRDIPHRIFAEYPNIARTYMDEGTDHISIHQVNGFYWDVFNADFSARGRRNTKFWDRKADLNSDGYVNKGELSYYVHLLGRKISQMPPPPVSPKESIVLHRGIQEWADFDGDGKFSDFELEDFGWLIYEILAEFHDLSATPIDFYFNLNQSYFLEDHEKENAFRYLLSKYFRELEREIPEYTEKYMDINKDGSVDDTELVGVAELYRLDNIYYLNLKLLEALSGEIINSSIAEAGSIQEFFAMCTDAVNNLQ